MNDKIQENIKNSYLFGCVKYKDKFSFYLMPIAYWVLNYAKYDPEYNPSDWEEGIVFRDDILNVNDSNIEPFIESIKVDEIDVDSVNFNDYNFEDIFLFFVDFDSKTFISYFDDIEIEEYLPDENWIGKFENPISYLPKELIAIIFPSKE
jgi:hypothetical protein